MVSMEIRAAPAPAGEHRVGQPYLVVMSGRYRLAIPSASVVTILDAPACQPIPDMPPHAAGIVNHADSALLVYDVRKRLGLPDVQSEVRALVEMLDARKQDHLRWMAKLKGDVEQGARISVQRDPNLCAFGAWYRQRSIHNYLVRQYLDRFDAPHRAIHGIADQAAALLMAGKDQDARALVDRAEAGILRALLWLFDGAADLVHANTHSYVVVCSRAGGAFIGLLVDELCELTILDRVSAAVPWVTGDIADAVTRAVGRVKLDGEPTDVILADLERLIDGHERDPSSPGAASR